MYLRMYVCLALSYVCTYVVYAHIIVYYIVCTHYCKYVRTYVLTGLTDFHFQFSDGGLLALDLTAQRVLLLAQSIHLELKGPHHLLQTLTGVV